LGKFCIVFAIEDIGIFYGCLVHLTAILVFLWPFGIFFGHLVCFSQRWYFLPRKIWQPWCRCDFGDEENQVMLYLTKICSSRR
jgi:hypothetical protein